MKRKDPATAPIPKGSALVQFAMAMLILEAFVILFFGLTVFGLKLVPTSVIWIACGTVALICLISAGLVRKNRKIGMIAGSIAQGLFLCMAVWIPLSLVVSLVFVFMWVISLYYGTIIDKERAQRRIEQAEWEAANPE